jgi:hypothetical protein
MTLRIEIGEAHGIDGPMREIVEARQGRAGWLQSVGQG